MQYYLLNGVKGQPHTDLRVKVIKGNVATDAYVIVTCCDIRLAGTESIVPVTKLTKADVDGYIYTK